MNVQLLAVKFFLACDKLRFGRMARACPLSQNLQRQDQQAGFHMAAFMGNWDDIKGESA